MNDAGWDVAGLLLSLGAPMAVAPGAPLLVQGLPPGGYRISLGAATDLVTVREGETAEVELGGS